MRLQKPALFLFIVSLFALGSISCKKDKLLNSGGQVTYSLDTLTFDTVFTASGSFTAQVKLYNPQNQKINISSIRLEGTDASFFHINVNGFSGNVTDMELAAKDSMYIFATVNINPTNVNNPFVINAKVTATMNGKDYSLPLMAYGLNAYYIVDSVMPSQTWKTDKPYVIIHSALVDAGQTLTIPAGARIYMNADSRLLVDGTLKIEGTKNDSVIFQSDRLDRKYYGYEGYPGEWGGLYFTSNSRNNNINYAILKNCGNSAFGTLPAAIQLNVDSVDDGLPTLVMNNTIVENSIGYGLISFGGSIVAQNCLFNGSGTQALATPQGGFYRFDNCNFITYGNSKISHIDDPMVALIDYFKRDDVTTLVGQMDAILTNCVIWGSIDNECHIEKAGDKFSVKLINCAIKQLDAIPAEYLTNRINVSDPQFEDYKNNNFRLKEGSPLINAGTTSTSLPLATDLDGKTRSGNPDVGCYER